MKILTLKLTDKLLERLKSEVKGSVLPFDDIFGGACSSWLFGQLVTERKTTSKYIQDLIVGTIAKGRDTLVLCDENDPEVEVDIHIKENEPKDPEACD